MSSLLSYWGGLRIRCACDQLITRLHGEEFRLKFVPFPKLQISHRLLCRSICASTEEASNFYDISE